MVSREERDALSSQSACSCPARPGQLHSQDCQYVIDLRASLGEPKAATDSQQ